MKRLSVALTVLSLFALALPAAARSQNVVTNANDSGPGSLRTALDAGVSPITIPRWVGDIELSEPLVWDSTTKLVIRGSGQALTDLEPSGDTVDDFDLLVISNGADTSISNLSLRGSGGFDIANKGGSSGIKLVVPPGATGTVAVDLNRVSISDVGLHGVHIDDLTNATEASIELTVGRVRVVNAGIGGFDQDGIRVDERGGGDLVFRSTRSVFEAVGADGVELDEGGSGDVVARVHDTDFNANGNYCSFRFAEDDLEAAGITLLDDFEELAIIIDPADEQAVRDLFNDNEEECLEFVEDDGEMEVAIDIDDALDIDEAEAGSIVSTVVRGSLVANEDEGLDYDESGPGNVVGSIERTMAADNTDEAVKYTELDGGSVKATVTRFDGPGQDVEFEEAGAGDLDAILVRSTIDDLSLVEEDAGSLDSDVERTFVDGIEGEETSSGNLGLLIDRSTVDDDIELEQQIPGEGTLTLRRSIHNGNLDLNGIEVD